MNGKSTGRIAVLIALGFVVAAGILGTILAHENAAAILGFCTLSCVALLAVLQKMTDNNVQDVQTIVNGQKTVLQERIDRLEKLVLQSIEKGVPVPSEAVIEVSKAVAAINVAAVEKVKNGNH